MVDLASELKAIYYLIAALVALVIWSIRLEALAKNTAKDLERINSERSGEITRLKSELASAWKRMDELNIRSAETERVTAVHKSMLRPENLEQHHVKTTKMEMKIEALEAHVAHLMSKGQ